MYSQYVPAKLIVVAVLGVLATCRERRGQVEGIVVRRGRWEGARHERAGRTVVQARRCIIHVGPAGRGGGGCDEGKSKDGGTHGTVCVQVVISTSEAAVWSSAVFEITAASRASIAFIVVRSC